MEPRASHRLHEVDLLRIIAAVSVMAYHYLFSAYAGGPAPMHFPQADVIARYGYLGVDLTQRLGRPWFAVLGALTYALYLIHAHIGFIVFERLGDQVIHVLLVAATMIAMVAAAAALHRWVERPLAPRLERLLERGGRQLAPTK